MSQYANVPIIGYIGILTNWHIKKYKTILNIWDDVHEALHL
jgi:hypothetical protein